MRIFTDFHHSGLLNSLILLFEGRLGHEVYRPIGVEWFENGFWNLYNHPATVQQFLGIGSATPDGSKPLNEVVSNDTFIYHCQDIQTNGTNKAITFDGFMNTDFDIVIASIPQHIEPFKRLCELHPNKPKLIYQIGNNWNVPSDCPAKNIMASAVVGQVQDGFNVVSYHQEFDLALFYPYAPTSKKVIRSFVNCFSLDNLFKEDWNLFLKVEKSMPDWKFESFGGQCRDGSANGEHEVVNFMAGSRYIWHTKAGGDGYGHVIHNTGAVARPTIVKKQYYVNKLAEGLMIDGKTCIAIDNLTVDEIINKINHYNEDERYLQLVQNVSDNFREKVNFSEDAEKIKIFLANLV